MTHEVARIMAQALMPLYDAQVLTVLGGLVKTASVERNGKIQRFPVPFGQDSQPIQFENSEFVPDSKQRAILYFEGNDSDVTDFANNKSKMRTNLRLVCWYDSAKYQIEKSESLHTTLVSAVLGRLPSAKRVPGEIEALTVRATKVYDSASRLFSQYTYKEQQGQYMQEPYFAFGIDIECTYQINHSLDCHGQLIPIDTTDCC